MSKRRRFRRRGRRGERPARLPCGCDPVELAAELGLPLDVLLRAAELASHPEDAGDHPVLVTIPFEPARAPPPDDAHLRN